MNRARQRWYAEAPATAPATKDNVATSRGLVVLAATPGVNDNLRNLIKAKGGPVGWVDPAYLKEARPMTSVFAGLSKEELLTLAGVIVVVTGIASTPRLWGFGPSASDKKGEGREPAL